VTERTGDSAPGARKQTKVVGRGTPARACRALILRSVSRQTGPLRCDTEAGLLQIIATGELGLRSQAERLRKMGTGDKIKGKVKEAIGSVTDSDHLRREGQAQQRKGHHEQRAAEAHAVAEKHEREAALSEDEKRARQVVRHDMPDEPVV
jgi:uncharacterized protein YjbJ (UPF0337 family)